ncbi:MAG: hypothetical protein ACT452_01015 [Microthrixaceae bacterium]
MAASALAGIRRGGPTLGSAVGAIVVSTGWVIGLRPLADNSFFTHLATGRVILDAGSVPTTDPYTFTAHGSDWLVQSWLASVLYASVERMAGASGLRVLMGLVAALLTSLAWRLSRPAAAIVPRLVIGVVFVVTGAELWSERPLMLGLVALACVMLAADGVLDPRWLIPIGWVWVNVHGSFPLGLVYLAVLAVGRRLDGSAPVLELRALGWLTGGVLLGAIGPLGPGVLTFPLELLSRQDVLRNVIEWQAPRFDSLSQRMFLVSLALVVIALIRRPSYRAGLVVATFTVAALLGSRNLTLTSLVFVPILAEAAPSWGSLRAGARTPVAATLSVVALAAGTLFATVRLGQRDFELRGYPVDAVAFLLEHDVDLQGHHLAAQDIVGNFLELVEGPGARVFYDDRFDMFPSDVSEAHLALVRSAPTVRTELLRYDVELVLWDRVSATGQRLVVDPTWRVLFTDEHWVLACERGADLGGALRQC